MQSNYLKQPWSLSSKQDVGRGWRTGSEHSWVHCDETVVPEPEKKCWSEPWPYSAPFEDYGIIDFATCLWIPNDSGLRRTLKDILNHSDTNREKWNLDPYYVLHTKIISIWIIDQCVKEETTKISKNSRAVSSRSWNRENILTWRKIQWMGVYRN